MDAAAANLLEQYSSWVKKVLTLKLLSTTGTGTDNRWMSHQLVMVKEMKGQLLGSLERNQINWLHDAWSEKALPYLERDDLHPEAKASIRSDITWIRQARICLDRLTTHEAEQAQKNVPRGNKQQTELTLANANAGRIPTPGVLATESTHANLGHENNGAVSTFKWQLLDPTYRESAEQFVAKIDAARKDLFGSSDAFDHKKIESLSEVLETLASTIGLGREFETLGQKLRYETYFRAAPLRPPRREGRPRKDDPPKEPDPWSPTDHWYMDMLSKLSEQEFETRLNKAVEEGSLSIKTFKVGKTREVSGHKDKSSKESTEDPLRFLVAFLADVRTNPDWYSPQQALKFSTDARVLENLGPVATEFLHFCATLGTEVRKQVEVQ